MNTTAPLMLVYVYRGSVPKDGREGLVNGDYVRKFVRIDSYESSNLIIRFSSLF